jgi:hypothetical protein
VTLASVHDVHFSSGFEGVGQGSGFSVRGVPIGGIVLVAAYPFAVFPGRGFVRGDWMKFHDEMVDSVFVTFDAPPNKRSEMGFVWSYDQWAHPDTLHGGDADFAMIGGGFRLSSSHKKLARAYVGCGVVGLGVDFSNRPDTGGAGLQALCGAELLFASMPTLALGVEADVLWLGVSSGGDTDVLRGALATRWSATLSFYW